MRDCDYCGSPMTAQEQPCREQGGDPPGTWMCSANTEPPCIAGEHYPNDEGTACYYCGLPAERMTPGELAEAWGDMLARQPVKGQTSWLD